MAPRLFLGRIVLHRTVAVGGVIFSMAALTAACGADVEDLFQKEDGTGGASTTSGKGATTGSSHAGPGNTTNTGPGSTTSGPTTTSNSTTVGPTTVVSSAESTTSSGGTTVACGIQSCAIDQGGCCYNNGIHLGNCSVSGNCFGNDTQILCAQQSDCPGQICCGQRNGPNDPYDQLSCVDDCQLNSLYVCNIANGNADCPAYDFGGGNIVQSICSDSTLLPDGYSVCKLPQN